MKILRLLILLAVAYFAVSTFFLSSTKAKSKAFGTFRVIKGDVKVQAAGQDRLKSARLGMRVKSGDTIITGVDSRAKLVMSDGNIVNLSPETYLEIKRYEKSEDSFSKNVELKVLYGKIRAVVNQKYDDDENKFLVKTPSAIAGVRGTDFFTSYSNKENRTKVVTFTGKVAFSKIDFAGKPQVPVIVEPGMFSQNTLRESPERPRPVPAQELKQLDVATYIPITPPAKSDEQKFFDHEPIEENSDEGERAPASPSTSPMVDPAADLGQCDDCQLAPVGPQLDLQGPPPIRVQIPDTEVCQTCDRLIEDGNTKVNINLVPGN